MTHFPSISESHPDFDPDLNPTTQQTSNIQSSQNQDTSQIIPSIPIDPIQPPRFKILKKVLMSVKQTTNPTKTFLKALDHALEPISWTVEDAARQLPSLKEVANSVKGLDFVVSLPFTVIHIHSLIKKRHHMSKTNKALKSTSVIQSSFAFTASLMEFTKFFHHLPKASTLIAAKISFVLGPIGLGLGTILATIKGAQSAIKAKTFTTQIKALNDIPKVNHPLMSPGFLQALTAREKIRLIAARRFAVFSAVQSFLLAGGLGAAGVTTFILGAGTVTALISNPVGWAALGLLLASSVLLLGVYAYRKWGAQKEIRTADHLFASNLVKMIDEPTKMKLKETIQSYETALQTEKNNYFHSSINQQKISDHLLTLVVNQLHIQPNTEIPLNRVKDLFVFLEELGLVIQADDRKNFVPLVGFLNLNHVKALITDCLSNEFNENKKVAEKKWADFYESTYPKEQIDELETQGKQQIDLMINQTLKQLLIQNLTTIKKEEFLSYQNLKILLESKNNAPTDSEFEKYAETVINGLSWPNNLSLVQEVYNELKSNS